MQENCYSYMYISVFYAISFFMCQVVVTWDDKQLLTITNISPKSSCGCLQEVATLIWLGNFGILQKWSLGDVVAQGGSIVFIW